eukprot:PLAT6892.2.p1 GENE.PLAT6892.2~~PLAT6892.2.p1  ORF type:complete len:639 (-),score=187.45 PLAT6892.2:151-1980(-)
MTVRVTEEKRDEDETVYDDDDDGDDGHDDDDAHSHDPHHHPPHDTHSEHEADEDDTAVDSGDDTTADATPRAVPPARRCSRAPEPDEPPALWLQVDGWRRTTMRGDRGVWSTARVIPPGPCLYFFTVQGAAMAAEDQPQMTVADAMQAGELTVPLPRFASTLPALNRLQLPARKPGSELALELALPRGGRGVVKRQVGWDLSKSIFAEFVQDTPDTLEACLMAELPYSKVEQLLKDSVEMAAVRRLLVEHFAALKDIFKLYSARMSSSYDLFAIGWNSFTDLVITCDIPCEACAIKDLDTIFIAANVKKSKELKQTRNPDRALARFEFLECLVRIAIAKYYKPHAVETPSLALKKLLVENILPHAERYPAQQFRAEKLYVQATDAVFRRYLTALQDVYRRYSGKYTLPGERAWMSVEEFVALLEDAGLLDGDFTVSEAKYAFVLSQMTAVDEMQTDSHTRMVWLEFLEALARVTDMKHWEADEPEDPQPLAVRLPIVLEMVVAAAAGSPRTDTPRSGALTSRSRGSRGGTPRGRRSPRSPRAAARVSGGSPSSPAPAPSSASLTPRSSARLAGADVETRRSRTPGARPMRSPRRPPPLQRIATDGSLRF